MKKIAFILSFALIFSSLSACKKIEQSEAKVTSSQTLQAENPVQTSKTSAAAISETSKSPEETSTVAESTVQTTSTAAQTTLTTTAVKASTTAKQTAPAATTTSAPATTAATTTTTAATTVATTAATTATATAVSQYYSQSSYTALNYDKQNAMWISYLEFQNILKGKTQAQFTASVKAMYDNCVALGINTVYVHARAHGDAYYVSDLFPWSANCTGTIAQEPSFDPFKILVDEAHARGLSIHAWINPMRGVKDTEIQQIPNRYLIKQWYNDSNKRGTYIVLVNGVWYFSPAYKEVRDLIIAGAKEIVSKYNVDGIHIDDYFYPTTQSSFDAAVFAQSGSSNLSQWRLDTISAMVRELYSGIKSVNSTVLFGVSPQGNVNNNYSSQYADVRKWCSQSGYLDYIVPQIYYGFKNTSQPYATNLQSWCDMVTAPGVKLVAGLAAYKIGTSESTGEWLNDKRILARQVETFRAQPKYGGAAFFRYESLFAPAASVAAQVEQEKAELAAILK